MVAHRLLAAPLQLVVAQVERALDHARRSASMVSWFCEVGGTMRARRIVPEPSISYRWKSRPRGASVAPVPDARPGVSR